MSFEVIIKQKTEDFISCAAAAVKIAKALQPERCFFIESVHGFSISVHKESNVLDLVTIYNLTLDQHKKNKKP